MRHRTALRVTAVAGLVAAIVMCTTSVAWASSVDGGGTTTDKITHTDISLNLLWIVVGAVLVIFMQAGFALVETGFCRAKHAADVVSTNFAIFGLGFVGYYCVGYAFMFGGYSFPNLFGYDNPVGKNLVGSHNWVFLWKGGFFLQGHAYDVGVMAFFLYMVAFMDTTATIPTGAMAERWKWNSFALWGLFCGAIYYPLFGAWTWGGGWLAKLGASASLGHGYVDFAGSGVVHMMGGVAGLAGALVLGPRIGKYGPDGKPRTLAGHHIPMAMLGTFILLFGWFGFNAASTLSATDNRFAVIATNTAIAAAFGAVFAMLWVQFRTPKHLPDPGMMANGMLAGLVAITAPCAFVQPRDAAIIGIIAGILVVESVWFFEKRGVDDPVGVVSVHGVCGAWGVLAVGIFADGTYGGDWNGTGSKTVERVRDPAWPRRWWTADRPGDRRRDDRLCHGRDRVLVLLLPEQADQGWHPAHAGGRAPGRRPPRDGSTRLPQLLWILDARRVAHRRRGADRATRTGAQRSGDLTLTEPLKGNRVSMHTDGAFTPAPDHDDDVVVVRWPEQRADAERLAALHRPHLLLVEPDAAAPVLEDCLADWIRLPAADADVRARLTALVARVHRHPAVPVLDGFGELSFRGRRVFLSPIDEQLATALVASFDHGVPDAELFDKIWDGGDASKVRVHISRLRKRIRPLGLEIASIRGFGYRLHVAHANVRHQDGNE